MLHAGLDPYEVLESLPTVLRDAFESQEIDRLQQVIASMNPKEAKYHMKRCVDSGLWIPSDSSIFEDDDQVEELEDKAPSSAASAGSSSTATVFGPASAADDIE